MRVESRRHLRRRELIAGEDHATIVAQKQSQLTNTSTQEMAIGHDSASGEYNNTLAADTIRFRSTYCHDSRNPTLHLNLSYSLLLRKKR